jgi:hypothetical protein
LSLGRQCAFIYGKSKTKPTSGDAAATQVVDSGIDLPGFDVIVDEGWMIRNHLGRVRTLTTDALTDKQRRGRVGRRKVGYAMSHSRAGTGFTATPYPTWARLLHEGQTGQRIRDMLKISVPFDTCEDHSKIDPYMAFRDRPSTVIEEVSLSAYWLLCCSGHPLDRINGIYDAITCTGWTEDLVGTRLMLETAYGTSALRPRAEINRKLLSGAFTVRPRAGPGIIISGGLHYQDNTTVSR